MRGLGNKTVYSQSPETAESSSFLNSQIRAAEAVEIDNYKDLVTAVAEIAFFNPEYTLFFRGQSNDYKKKGNSTMLPSIYRGITPSEIKPRIKSLKAAERALLQEYNPFKLASNRKAKTFMKLDTFRELAWAVLQHYEVCSTPLLDITHSLRVASSFALRDKNEGYVMVIALPYPQGSISYYAEDELLIVRLLNACPPDAVRPYFQEGYLVGSFPFLERYTIIDKHEVARRLVAKFKIKHDKFWGKDFQAIPSDLLYPNDDKFESICRRIKNNLAQIEQ